MNDMHNHNPAGFANDAVLPKIYSRPHSSANIRRCGLLLPTE